MQLNYTPEVKKSQCKCGGGIDYYATPLYNVDIKAKLLRGNKMYEFVYCTPTKVVFGENAEGKLGGLLKEYGAKKVLLHYGGGSALKGGLLTRVRWLLEEDGIAFVELGGVKPNPRLSLVEEGVALCKSEGVDFIVAIGGGSVIDSAKAIGMAIGTGCAPWDLYSGGAKPSATLPVGVILTLSASGSEMSNSSVITNDYTQVKKGCTAEVSRPVFAILNPALTFTVPPYATACGCADIAMHTMERYLSGGNSLRVTDAIGEEIVRTVTACAKQLVKNPQDYEARANVMWAGSLSHNGLTGCGGDGGDWATHTLGHELSALYDVAHGAALTALWGAWARYVYRNVLGRFYTFAVQAMGVRPNGSKEEIALKGIEAVEDWFRAIGLPTSIGGLGITLTDEQVRDMAHRCAEHCGGVKGSCVALKEEDMYEIYKAAL